MATPTKFDALLQLRFLKECTFEGLVNSFSSHAKYENLSQRNLRKTLGELINNGLARGEKDVYSPAYESPAKQILAFLLWCRKDSLDFNELLGKRMSIAIENIACKSEFGIKDIGFSRATSFKYFNLLKDANFLRVTKKKPLRAIFNINDKTLHYPFAPETEKKLLGRLDKAHQKSAIALENLEISQSPKFLDKLVRLHVYSSTVTEGNTASEEDVEKVVNNLPTGLTPRETIEIKNTKDAVDFLLKEKSAGLDAEYIKKIHALAMNGLVESPGHFEASGTKRIIGSELKLPTNLDSILFSIDSLVGFYNRNKKTVNPLILASVVHFWFVTVHPFIDGNGRVARLIHSKILYDNDLPLFVFDPNKKNQYFNALEESRSTSIETFIEFTLSEHYRTLKEYQ